MVESTIRTARRTAPVKLVNASRGKVQRAEPVAALYAQGKVRHVGHFAELERQYCLFSTGGMWVRARPITPTRRSGD
jgi:phage terminase large subunit-like protein